MSPSQAGGGAEGENKYLFISRNSSDTKHCLVSAGSDDRGLNMTLTQISSRIYNYILSHLNMKTRRRVMCATFLFDIDTCILSGVFSIWQQCTYLFTLHKPNGLSLTKYVAIFQLWTTIGQFWLQTSHIYSASLFHMNLLDLRSNIFQWVLANMKSWAIDIRRFIIANCWDRW